MVPGDPPGKRTGGALIAACALRMNSEENMITRMAPLVAAMVAASAFAAAAQQPTHPMHGQNQSAMPCDMHGMMMGSMAPMGSMGSMGGTMNDSSMMAQMHAQLGLTDAQMQQMRAAHQRACVAAQPHLQLAMQAHRAAMEALQGDKPNLDHYEDQLDKAAKHMVEAQVEMAKAMIEFRKTLTPAQRRKMDEMHQRMMPGR
jgi:Spy/CpxP family protein refolding chaperone